MNLGIGIDTGGTYTDAVIYDIEAKKIHATSKALTTKYDLSEGILAALDALPADLLQQARLIALSTTLATNACVENKGGRAKLVFIGVDKRVIAQVGQVYGLPPLEDICFLDCTTRMSGHIETEPDWEAFDHLLKTDFAMDDAVAVVEIHSMNNNAVLEHKARDMVQAQYNIPVVCGSELSQALNSVQRGAGTLLNGRLIPVIQEFLHAVKIALAQRGITAPMVVVRSDGSLMSESFTENRPVETLLSGPAASVIGGLQLTDATDAIVIDMGGTTTDSAIIKAGVPVKAKDGINVGKWRTFVQGLYIDTYGLGGDSAVRHIRDKLDLGDTRVIPLCILAEQYPSVTTRLKQLLWRKAKHTKWLHEFYVLIKDITGNPKYTAKEQAFCRALSKGPLSLLEAVEAAGTDVYNFNMDRLEREGIVMRAGLTPTDMMHIKGDYTRYKKEASLLGAKFVANNLYMTVDALCQAVYNEVKRKIYFNVVRILLEEEIPHFRQKGISEDVALLINNSWENSHLEHNFLSTGFKTPAALIGIGAPIHVFLPDVAKALGTTCIIPEHAGVANALGAIVGNISATVTIDIKPGETQTGGHCFTVFGLTENHQFTRKDDAINKATEIAEAAAVEEAKHRGAVGHITVKSQVENFTVGNGPQAIFLDAKVVATAVGGVGSNKS